MSPPVTICSLHRMATLPELAATLEELQAIQNQFFPTPPISTSISMDDSSPPVAQSKMTTLSTNNPTTISKKCTTIVQNMAALCPVPEAITAVLTSLRDHSNLNQTFFLLKPYETDHLGTIHHTKTSNKHHTLVIILPEVLYTDDDTLMKLPNVHLNNDETNTIIEFCPVKVGRSSVYSCFLTMIVQHRLICN